MTRDFFDPHPKPCREYEYGRDESESRTGDFIASAEASDCPYEFRPFASRSFTYTANWKKAVVSSTYRAVAGHSKIEPLPPARQSKSVQQLWSFKMHIRPIAICKVAQHALTGSDPSVTDYVLEVPARCFAVR